MAAFYLMKHTQKLLVATLVLTPALFAFTPRGTALKFSVAEGSTKTKTFTSNAELTLDDMGMLLNGQESPMMPDIEMAVTTNFSVTVSDDYLAMGDGQPKKLKRSFDSVEQSTDMEMEIDVMGQVQNNDMSIPTSSELDGAEILFTWDDELGDYVASFPEEEGDKELLEGLTEDMDLRSFLPGSDVSEGDEWEVEPFALLTVLAPGGNLKLIPEDIDSADAMGMNQDMGDFNDWFTEDMEGAVNATFKGTKETEDGAKVGVIAVSVKITNAVDLTEMMQEGLSELPDEAGEMEVSSMDLALELEGEGTLLWNLSAGCAHSFEMTSDFGLQMDIAMSLSTGGMEMDIEQSMEFSGSLTSTASVE